jgi:transglutaminase-like putative cysteine protease
MTATTFGQVRAEAAEERHLPVRPAEGWTTLGLVLLLCLTVAWSVDDASWVVGPRGLTDFLAWAVALGVVWGFVSAKVGWSRWLAHLLGATFAALIMPMIVGSRLVEGGGPVEWFQATAASAVNAYFDLTYRALPLTTQIGHFMLTLALVCWATGQFAGYATFHHRRPLNAVIVVGVGLVANMSLTIRDQLPYLVLYSLAALFLLIRFHAYDERMLWLRHRIGDAASLGGLYLRGGSVFVAGAVVVALFLTASASSDPLAGMWKGVDQKLIDVGREFQRVFRGGGGGTRLNAVDFSGSASISGIWTTDNSPVMNVDVPDAGHYYWRAVTYDKFDGRSWTWSQPTEATVDAGAATLAGSADDPTDLEARHEVAFTVRELRFDPQAVFSPDTPTSVDVPTKLTTVTELKDEPGFYSALTADASSYKVSALVPIDGSKDPAGGLTANKLRVAGTDYPASVKALYLGYDPALIGPATRQLMSTIFVAHPEAKESPYDLARSITSYLISEGGFTYDADVSDIDCHGSLVVECFAVTKRGYCEYYASTLALLLRWNGVPARLAEGFLPGERDAAGTELIRKSGSHAWVEVYFPRYGWVPFDPTGGSIGQDVPLPAGPVVSAPPATPRPSLGPDEGRDPRRSIRPASSGSATGAGGTGRGGPGSGPFIVIGLLLAIVVGGLAFIAWQRGPRTAAEPDVVWRSVVALARRFGFAPRPSQTVFEYTTSLGEVLPNARPDLQTVARAKVEVAYGRGRLGEDRLRNLRDAQRRLRVALLALAFRRRERRERRARGR